MKRVQAWNEFVSPRFYGPLAIWPWLRISHHSYLNVIYLIITAWQWLMNFPYTPCIPMLIKPIKACQGKGQGTLLLRTWLRHSEVLSPWESGHAITFLPQDLIVNLSHLSHNASDTAYRWLCQTCGRTMTKVIKKQLFCTSFPPQLSALGIIQVNMKAFIKCFL